MVSSQISDDQMEGLLTTTTLDAVYNCIVDALSSPTISPLKRSKSDVGQIKTANDAQQLENIETESNKMIETDPTDTAHTRTLNSQVYTKRPRPERRPSPRIMNEWCTGTLKAKASKRQTYLDMEK
ncbi:11777_t:CDS:2 [Gigaspora rosea]|nr:11777_t:CDS:2 [Gigaspora rosea]